MHITHVNFAKGFRGGERQTLNLIEGLATLGMSQILVCRRNSELQARSTAIGIATQGLSHPLLGHLSVQATQVIHVHEARGAYWAALERFFRGTPYLITRRIPNPLSGTALTRFVYKNAAQLVGVSDDVAGRLEKTIGRTPRTILDSSTTLPVNREKTAAIRAMLGEGPVIGHVGALQDHHKGQSILIEAFRRVSVSHPNARLLLVGEGPDRERFEQLAAGDPRIVFAGFQQNVGDWIAAMDVFAFPSREEGLGSSVLDAMLIGVPAVTSAAGGLPELNVNQKTTLMVESLCPADWASAIRHLLSDPEYRSLLIESARSFAQTNDVAAMTERYVSVYRELLSRSCCADPIQ